MSEPITQVEELLRRDREAGVPEPPEVGYTVAAVSCRLSRQARSRRPAQESEWWLFLVAVCLMMAAVLWFGIKPWWLFAISVTTLCLSPILLRKGV